MKDLYYIETNAYDMVVVVAEDKSCKYLIATEDFPIFEDYTTEEKAVAAKEFLESIFDTTSGWEDDCDYYQLIEEFADTNEIIAHIETDDIYY